MLFTPNLWYLCCVAVCFCLATFAEAVDSLGNPSATASLFASDPLPSGRSCAPTHEIPIHGANLTAEEIEILDYICWDATATRSEDLHSLPLQGNLPSGIPQGVDCTPTEWCDSGQCTEVCARGSVVIEPWLANAARLQARLSRTLPFCFSCFFGTHNSAISLADGYGSLDPQFQALFKYVKWASHDFSHAVLRTNNQWLSLTDQLNLGVRVVEIDTHWVGGALRVAHCGGLHVSALNTLVKALNTVAKLLGHHIRWDTETMGCDPSLSSIPALSQRTVLDAFEEIKAWMDAPENADELVVLFFDDQPNLAHWGVAPKLQEEVLSVFSQSMIFTREDLANEGWKWPSAVEMVASGRRLVLLSVADYGDAMAPTIFPRGPSVCGWSEPSLGYVLSAPECRQESSTRSPAELFTGSLVRVSTCELEYGPLNCDFVWNGGNAPFFDEATIPEVVDCGLNIPSPDLLTPSRAAAAIWTWAAGHPFEGGGECAVLGVSDGRWRTVDCEITASKIGAACRKAGTPVDSDDQWVIVPASSGKAVKCPEGSAFDVPRHARENSWLAAALRAAGLDAAWLPVYGPDWAVDGVPTFRQQILSS